MLEILTKISMLCCLVLVIAISLSFAQVVGGGSLEKPVASQLGGLVSANVFKKLSNPVPVKKLRPAVTKPTGRSTTAAKSGKIAKTTPKTKTQPTITDTPETISGLTFDPVPNAGIDRELVAAFTENRAEQEALLELFRISKNVYGEEVSKKGRSNDVAMALTFFIATCVTVYHDAPEPSEAALDNLYESLADLMSQEAGIVNSSNIDKQILHDRLVYISGLVLGGYSAAKEQNDSASLTTFRLLAGVCLKSLMQLEPDNLKFDQNGLVVK
jgi:hypothetical protein